MDWIARVEWNDPGLAYASGSLTGNPTNATKKPFAINALATYAISRHGCGSRHHPPDRSTSLWLIAR
jgi:hypothetical protein